MKESRTTRDKRKFVGEMKRAGEPLVTVTIPMYNNERFIRQTIESILSQTYTNFELLIYDDNSTDSSYEIATSFRDTRMRVFRNKRNLGPEGNWNKAIRGVSGKYVKLICGDDILYPKCLEKQVAVFEKKNTCRYKSCLQPADNYRSGREIPHQKNQSGRQREA